MYYPIGSTVKINEPTSIWHKASGVVTKIDGRYYTLAIYKDFEIWGFMASQLKGVKNEN
jgi:hypothetical protein